MEPNLNSDQKPSNEDVSNKLSRFGLGIGDKPSDKPADKSGPAADGDKPPTTIKIGDTEFTPEQIAGQIQTLQNQLQTLSGADAQANRTLTTQLTEALKKLVNPEKPVESFEPTKEELEAWKKEMDEKAVSDFTGTTLELAGGIVRNSIKPLMEEIKKLNSKIESMENEKKESTSQTEAKNAAFQNISKAFKEANTEVSDKVWLDAVKYFNDNFGTDLVHEAYNNPSGLSKKLKVYLGSLKGASSPLAGLPAGGGSSSGEHQKSDDEKVRDKMKRFGL